MKKKKLLKFNNKKMNNPVMKWAKDMNIHVSKEGMQMSNEHKKRCSTSSLVTYYCYNKLVEV